MCLAPHTHVAFQIAPPQYLDLASLCIVFVPCGVQALPNQMLRISNVRSRTEQNRNLDRTAASKVLCFIQIATVSFKDSIIHSAILANGSSVSSFVCTLASIFSLLSSTDNESFSFSPRDRPVEFCGVFGSKYLDHGKINISRKGLQWNKRVNHFVCHLTQLRYW